MHSSQFMDKQIMGLQGSHQNNDFMELLTNPSEEHSASKTDDIVPSYDFQPIRPIGTSQSLNLDNARPSWSSTESKSGSSLRNYGSVEPSEQEKSAEERGRDVYDMDTVAEIDRTMKKHADNLLHALEGVSARLTQLESRTRHLESSVDELKVQVGNNHGNNDGRLRQLEIVLREVQTGVQVLRDKQEIAEAHLQLSKLQVSKSGQPTENTKTTQAPAIPPSQQPLPQQPQIPALPPPNAPPPPPPQPQNQPPQLPPESFYPHSTQQPEASHPQYPPPSQQTAPPPQHYQTPPQLPQYSQPAPQLQQHQPPPLGPMIHPPPQSQPPLALPPAIHHHPEETSYVPSHSSYLSGPRQPAPPNQPPGGPLPSQQYYGPTSQMYEPPPIRPGSGQLPFQGGYGPPSGPNFSENYAYTGSLPLAMKPPQLSPSAPTGGSNYPRLPTAQILPHAIPTASNISSGSGSGTGNRVPVDDVVDRVTSMGFPRDMVRATVKKLTENGQAVDLNVVLDKLMNGGEIQPQKGWFGR